MLGSRVHAGKREVLEAGGWGARAKSHQNTGDVFPGEFWGLAWARTMEEVKIPHVPPEQWWCVPLIPGTRG